MTDSADDSLICSRCRDEVGKGDQFCRHCGRLLEENHKCSNHPDRDAEGVCIICCVPYCVDCGGWVNGLFLCENHADYEIYEGMVRVYGASDEVNAQYVQKCLEQSDLHPMIFARKANPISGGGADHTLFRASGEYDGHIVNEMKVLIPCQEVLKAERILQDLQLKM